MCYTQLILLLLALANNLLKLQPEEVNLVDHIHLQKELLHMAAANNHHGDKSANIVEASQLYASPETIGDTSWYPDIGATHHLTTNAHNLSYTHDCQGDQQIQMGDGSGFGYNEDLAGWRLDQGLYKFDAIQLHSLTQIKQPNTSSYTL
uniref:Uncharacterized protein n=1 Tax=Cannabis sativa TaxID=3483 RepID=A0A803PS09_CANSA